MLEDFRLKVFMAVEREGNFTRAARTLGISQPAVSQNIAELEKEIGTELFKRTKGSVTLTPAGSAFKEYAIRILQWCSAAEDMFGTAGKLKSVSPVIIEADGYSVEVILPHVLETVVGLNPGLSFKVSPPGSLKSPDLLLTCRPHAAQMSLEDGETYLGPVKAVALSDNPGFGLSRAVQPGLRLAVWTPYLPLLPLDLASKVVLDTYSLSMLRGLSLSDFVVLMPKDSRFAGLPALDADLSFLDMDLHALPSVGFKGTAVYRSLQNLLKTFL